MATTTASTVEKVVEETHKAVLTPPPSDQSLKHDDTSSELSDIEMEDDPEIVPDHYWDNGKVPVFKPVRGQGSRYLKANCKGNHSTSQAS
jgi:hypothetical protein